MCWRRNVLCVSVLMRYLGYPVILIRSGDISSLPCHTIATIFKYATCRMPHAMPCHAMPAQPDFQKSFKGYSSILTNTPLR